MSVIIERTGHITSIRLNRPEAANAIDGELAAALGDAVRAADDSDARAIVISGAGKGFSAGLDLGEFAAGGRGLHPAHPEWGFAGIALQPVATPVIAAVHGFAVGGGAEVALAADLIVADEDATFAFPETGLGLVAGGGGLLRLPQAIAPRIAMELLLTGRRFTAREAHGWGLVNVVSPAGEAAAAAQELAARIADKSPVATRATKQAVLQAVRVTEADWWNAHTSRIEEVLTSADADEGVRAFSEKRAPRW